MILLCGIPSETPLAMVVNALREMDAPFAVFNQREFGECTFDFRIAEGRVEGLICLGSEEYELAKVRSVFVRLMDDRLLPELDNEPPESPARRACRALHDSLTQWFEIAPARVLNRYSAMGSNGSKPYQAQLITKHGFRTPETLVTNNPAAVLEFRQRHGSIIYKSVSGVRSIVSELTEADMSRLDFIRYCPVQFQERIEGDDVRVHVVDTEVFATAIASSSTDYRYAHQQGSEAHLRAIDLPDRIADQAVTLAADLGLPLAGIDLMMDREGRIYCLEVNPSPAFSYYELSTGQPIARAIARYLAMEI